MNFWRALEDLRGLVAVPAGWRTRLDGEFEAVRGAFLRARPGVLARSVPCPRECGCAHEVIRHPDGRLVGVCRCESWNCEDLPLREEELVLWELNWSRLGRALAAALACEPQESVLGVSGVRQIGSCNGAPVLLSIQHEPAECRSALAELAVRLPQGFLVLSPSSRFVDARARELLAHARAGFADLESHLALLPGGKLQARQTAAELFQMQNEECRVQNGAGGARDAEEGRRKAKGQAARSAAEAPHAPPVPAAPRSTLPASPGRYSLRKDLGVWHLVFDGGPALLRQERGLLYIAWLLYHPPAQPLHALDLLTKIPEFYRAQLGLVSLTDPATGRATALESHARLQERSLALDEAQSLRALRAQERELEAILEDETATEPVKAEALRELEALAQFQRQHGQRSREAADVAARTMRKALRRVHERAAAALDAQGRPHPVLRAFAEHLQRYLLVPSNRYAAKGNRHARSGLAGCFTYEPPPGVHWTT